jgi:hypothetical protein
LNLALSLQNVGLCHLNLGVSLCNFSTRTLRCGFLFGAIQPEEWRAFADRAACTNVDLGNPTIDLRNDWDGSEEQSNVLRGRMIVKNYGD